MLIKPFRDAMYKPAHRRACQTGRTLLTQTMCKNRLLLPLAVGLSARLTLKPKKKKEDNQLSLQMRLGRFVFDGHFHLHKKKTCSARGTCNPIRSTAASIPTAQKHHSSERSVPAPSHVPNPPSRPSSLVRATRWQLPCA